MEHHHPTERPKGREQESRPAAHTPEIADPSATGASEEPNAVHEAIAAGIQVAERSEQEIEAQRDEACAHAPSRSGSLVGRPVPASQEVPPRSMEARTDDPALMSPAQQVRHYLHVSFQEADRLGRPIDHEVARAVATLLAATVPPPSALRRFAETGQPEVEPVRRECRQLVIRNGLSADRLEWARRLDHYLAALGAAGVEDDDELAHEERGEHRTDHTVAEGIRQHGDAFRAFLELPDTERLSARLLDDFVAAYVGAFESMDAIIDGLTEIRDWQTALDEFADQRGLHGLVSIDRAAITRFATEVWDIARLNGRLYVFNK